MAKQWGEELPLEQSLFFLKQLFWVLIPLLLCSTALQPAAGCAAEAEELTSIDTLILCRSCGHELAVGADIRPIHSGLALSRRNETLPGGRKVHVQLFQNPHGHKFEVITFRKADVSKHWPADKHFSWFPGFSWTMATCPRCKTHLGGYRGTSELSEDLEQLTIEKKQGSHYITVVTINV